VDIHPNHPVCEHVCGSEVTVSVKTDMTIHVSGHDMKATLNAPVSDDQGRVSFKSTYTILGKGLAKLVSYISLSARLK